MIRDGVLQPQPVWEAPPHPATDNGLQFITLHPRFAENRLVYLSHPKRGEKGNTLAVSRGRFDGTTLADVKEIFVADAWETSGNMAGPPLLRARRDRCTSRWATAIACAATAARTAIHACA